MEKDKSQCRIAVIFFAFNRPHKLKETIRSYKKCSERQLSDIFVFVDGARNENDKEKINECLFVTTTELPAATISVRDYNLGLKQSIWQGVTEVLSKYDAAIVIEDDLELAPDFYRYMRAGLERYQFEDKVCQISGFNYLGNGSNSKDCFFLPLTTSWGWATWARAWRDFSVEDTLSLKNLSLEERKFNLEGSFPFLSMLKKEADGKVNSWAIRWYLYSFLHNRLTLYPPTTMVNNDGFDSSGTHAANKSGSLFSQVEVSVLSEIRYPADVDIDKIQLSLLICKFNKFKTKVLWNKFVSYFRILFN
ncbi:glycosyltransferase family 2 protein [Gallaecimonas pentaromativorans]|uniref:GNT-I family protein n=1 Tax=Gallaecimonas pentaromativorans TaxID=584787 RepID=A0A3N1P2A1_9GAMM|nr:glycosyltransferase family 2 protein [Gallaecimonas pentaromativorans]ROQ22533.1 GNT-I family protein [Gallaecimonas pentaromativorans]